jgi:Stress responsive A/B Barrel Domain
VFSVLRLISLPRDRTSEVTSVVAALRQVEADLPGVGSSWIAPVLPTSTINASDIVWRMVFPTESQALAVPLAPEWRAAVAPALEGTQVTSLGYRVTRMGRGPDRPGVWRGLLFRVMPHGFPDLTRQLESELLLFPDYVASIRSWALNSVSFVEGPKAFTHVWEQEYDDLEGLTGEYMMHPVHWGLADRFFDAESPLYVVDPYLVQVIGTIGGTILGAHATPSLDGEP